MVASLQEALDAAKGSSARCLALTGEGEAFSAGADLKALEELSRSGYEENLADSTRLARLFETIATHPLPVIAAVNGHAIAGGAGLAVACDLTVAAEGALLGFTEVRIGFLPAIILNFILRAAGEKAARDLCLTGRRIDAAEALRRGLLSEVVPGDRLAARVREIGAEFAKAGPAAVAATKALFLRLRHLPLDAGLRLGAEENARSRAGDEWREGVRAFLEKRRPAWDR
jgi:methylglutaconyl-CoA hydratase